MNHLLHVDILRDEFRFEPQSTRVAAGEDIVMECSPPKGTPDPQVFWRKDGQTLAVDGRLKLVDGYNLAVTDTRTSDDGRYQCVAKNTAGVRESAVAVLKVYVKPFMVRPPEDIVALVGSTVEFLCAVGGDPIPDVLWRRTAPGGTMPLGRVRVLEDRTLRLEHVTLLDQGRYTCDADNFAGAISASSLLTVHAPPTFSTRPLAQTIEAGQEVTFHCSVKGNPKPFIFWTFEGDRALVYSGSPFANFEAYTSSEGVSTLILKDAHIQNSGTVVICSAINAAGSASTRTRLTVTSKEDRPPPVIIRGPVNQTLPIDSVAYLTCEATGSPKPVISWYKEGVPVSPSNRINMTNPSQIEIYKLQKEDSGSYTCVASSRGGKATWSGHLLVENPKNPNINFFKAPEPIMLPGPPSRPHALNQSEGSVTLTWGQNNKIGSSSLLGYQVELFGREEGVTPTWTIVARRIPGPTYTQHLLSAGVPYTFLVRAENAHGVGPPSQLSEPVIVGPDSTQNWGIQNSIQIPVPIEPPSNMEALLLNSTTVYLKWKPPPTISLNGELQGYKVEIKTNGSISPDTINVGKTPTLLLGNLTSGVSYFVRVAASTGAGLGPFNPAATLRLDPASRTSDNNNQRPVGADMQSGDFITETWFMALLISMVSVMVLLFGAMFLVRKRQMLSKKTMTPSRSNGGVLTTPMASKQEAPLWLEKETLPDYSSTLPEYSKLTPQEYNRKEYNINGVGPQCNGLLHHGSVNLHSNPLHQNEFSRPDKLEYSSEKCYPISRRNYKDYSNMQVQEYASPNLGPDSNRMSQIADYAEVDTNMCKQGTGSTSPAPYATTTLVAGKRMVIRIYKNEECPYPSSNGGYYNRKVYSDSYFAPTHTLKRIKKERKSAQENPPDLVSPSGQPVCARVGPPGLSWRNGTPSMTSFTPHKQVYHGSTRSEPDQWEKTKWEAAEVQAKKMEVGSALGQNYAEDVRDAVDIYTKNQDREKLQCFRCGSYKHFARDKECRARGVQCSKCHKT
ncbi:hypothetical protein NQ314_010977 [Rhamnusium bicolor]|uniref:Uncharacterized protein n=1 Tax=Rhamnusium bicolor TaxID=1586634 RepID=A0AAV8XMN7_9CUCU|nr:hypothetical protein NQ314_010977 [Rhamnusium bicolor]